MASKATETVEENNQTLQPPPPSHAGGKKPKDKLIRDQVDISDPDVNTKKRKIVCKHCAQVWVRVQINVTRIKSHLLECTELPPPIKDSIEKLDQAKKVKQFSKKRGYNDASDRFSSSSSSSNSNSTSQSSSSSSSSNVTKKFKPGPPIEEAFMNEKDAYNHIMTHVKSRLARFEVTTDLQDAIVIAGLEEKCPGIKSWIPADDSTTYSSLVQPLASAVDKKITELFASVPGHFTFAGDGVQIQGRSHVCYTLSKGQYTSFHSMQYLKEYVHVSEAEVKDAYKHIKNMIQVHGTHCFIFAVDNAAKSIAEKLQQMLENDPDVKGTFDILFFFFDVFFVSITHV